MSIDQILKRNGDSMHIKAVKDLSKFEDDPLLIFGWENVDSFVNSLNQQSRANFPAPFLLPALPINSGQFKLALLSFIRDQNDPSTRLIGTSVIQCTSTQ